MAIGPNWIPVHVVLKWKGINLTCLAVLYDRGQTQTENRNKKPSSNKFANSWLKQNKERSPLHPHKYTQDN